MLNSSPWTEHVELEVLVRLSGEVSFDSIHHSWGKKTKHTKHGKHVRMWFSQVYL